MLGWCEVVEVVVVVAEFVEVVYCWDGVRLCWLYVRWWRWLVM